MMRLLYRYLSIYLSIYLLLCLFITSSAYAAPVYKGNVYIDQTITYYDINGLTSNALRREMAKKGPRTKALSARRYALTQWRIHPRIEYLSTRYGCEVGNVNIDLSIEYIYPNWVNRADAHPQVIKRWDGFYMALVEYEQMHANNGIAAANRLAKDLLYAYSRRTCKGMEDEINLQIMGILQEYFNEDARLDWLTGNGDSKGVWLP